MFGMSKAGLAAFGRPMSGAGDAVVWWQTRWALAALVLLAAVPLLWPTVPALIDLPGHIGRFRVQLDIDSDAALRQFYAFKWQLVGNLGVDLLVVPMSKLFGLELATKLIVLTIPPLTVLGLLMVAREAHGAVPPTALFALPFAYAQPFIFGFVNFALAMALALIALALWMRLGREGRTGLRAALAVPLSFVLWLVHTFGWCVLGMLAFCVELFRQRAAGATWLRAVVKAGVAMVPLAGPFVLMLAWRAGQAAGQGDWFNWGSKALWLLTSLRDRWDTFDLVSLLVVLGLIGWGLGSRRLAADRALALGAGLLLAMFIILPRIVFGSHYADMRLIPYALALGVLMLRPSSVMSAGQAGMVALAGLAFFGIRVAAHTASFALYHQSYTRELAALEHIPEGARLVSFTAIDCPFTWYTSRLGHLPALALSRKRAYANDQWMLAGGQLISSRLGAPGFEQDPSQLVLASPCPWEPWRTLDAALVELPRERFDYVWLIAPPLFDAKNLAGMVQVWSQGTSALYRIERPARREAPSAR